MTFHEGWRRLLGALGLGPRQSDLAGELEFHREMLEAQHRARGLEPAAARRAAAIDLGGAPQIAEAWRDQRGLPFLDMLRQDVRYGLRILRRAPGFTAAALATLALGIGANTAMFSVVDAVLLRPLPYVDPDRLVTVGDRTATGFSSNVGFATVVDWRTRSRSFEALALTRGWGPTLVLDGVAEVVPSARVSWNYFDLLGIRPALGRGFTADDDRGTHWRVLLLSDRFWRQRFGADPAAVGRTLRLNDTDFQIVGVMPASYEALVEEKYHQGRADIWAPIGYDLNGPSSCRSCRHLRAFGRLKPGVTVAAATAEMNAIREEMRHEFPTDYESGSIALVPLNRALTSTVRDALTVLMAAVGFVLLIACANVGNLLLARSVARQRELTLRAVLGAGRARLFRQLFTESALLSIGGASAGIALAAAAVAALKRFAPVALPRLGDVGIDGRVLAFTAVTSIAATLVFGLMPVVRAGAGGAHGALAVDSRSSVGGRSRLRGALVVADLMLALVLLAGAGLMLRTVAALARVSPGFAPERVLSFQFALSGRAYTDNAAVLAFQERAVEQLRALPGVEAAALAGQIPFGGSGDCWGFHVQGRLKANPADDPCVERYGVTPDYLRIMNIAVLSGRGITAADTASSAPVLVITRSTAREVFGSDDPIGARVRVGPHESGPWRTIVGVVADVHHADLTETPSPAMYTPQSQLPDSGLTAVVKAATADAATLQAPARAAIRGLDAAVPVSAFATLADLVAASAARQQFVMRLLAGFAIVSLTLAAVGLYGLVAYSVTQRTREVGVRVALGARRADVVRVVLSSGLRLVALGVALGVAAALAASRSLGSLVFGVSPSDPATFAGAAAVLVGVALLAHWIPVRRALRIDPATALRAE